jgi:hypothetical protein
VQSIDQDIVAEGMWYYNLRNLNEHNLNQTINVLKNIAESTKRLVYCILDKMDISSSVEYLFSFLGDKHFKNISS